MEKESIGKAFSRLGIQAKQKIAAERLAKVKVLREQKKMTGPQIAAALNIKLRTVYEDFKKINQEKNAQDAP